MAKKRNRKILDIFLVAFAIVLVVAVIAKKDFRQKVNLSPIPNITAPAPVSISKSGQTVTQEPSSSQPSITALPKSKELKVPFLSQAPNANWDSLHEDACEEASLIMVDHSLKNVPMSVSGGETEIQNLISWETQNGYGTSITLSDLSKIAKNQFDLSGRVETNISIDGIKKELANGKPVIVPAAGKKLGNPNFRNGGPNYHMLVIKGYDSSNFITNDPGTRKGEGYIYKFDILINAIHDWDASNILNGKKSYLVFD